MSDEATNENLDDAQITDSETTDESSAREDSPETKADSPDSQSESSGESQPPFDASRLSPIEPAYEDDELNDFFRAALTPISDENPCGKNEDQASSVISQIETTGDAIHESLRTAFGDAVRDDNMSAFDMTSAGRDAGELVEQIIECLEYQCKSIILASYLPHLMLISHGLPGFAAGLDICRELVERYPDLLFPQEKDRVANYLRRGVYVGNDDKVTDNYKLFLYLPITERNNLPYALLRNSRMKGANPDAEGRYANDAAGSSPEFYVKLTSDIQMVVESSQQANATLAAFLSEQLMEIVSYSFIESVERMGSIVENLASENCSGYPPVDEEAIAEAGSSAGPPGAATTGEIVNRDQAIELLRRIADFFHRTERHSPVSYRIRETVRWCKMDLPELMHELLSGDEGPLDELGKRVGFRNREDSGDDYNDQ